MSLSASSAAPAAAPAPGSSTTDITVPLVSPLPLVSIAHTPAAPPQILFAFGAREMMVMAGLGAAAFGWIKFSRWNDARLVRKAEKKKIRDAEWAKMKQQLLSSVKLGAVLGTIGLLSYTYFKISASFQTNAATSRRRIGEARMQ